MQFRKIVFTRVLVILFISFLASCSSNLNVEEKEEEASSEFVSLTREQMEVINLQLIEFKPRSLTIEIPVSGSLDLLPQDKAFVSSIVGGIVKDIRVIEGDEVRKGEHLATIEHPNIIQLQQDYINHLNTLKYLKIDFERQSILNDGGVGADKKFQKINADYKNQQSLVNGLEIKLKMLGLDVTKISNGVMFSGIPIVSPIKGSISKVNINLGTHVEPLKKLFEIVNNEKLHADFRIYESDISKVEKGQKIYFTTHASTKEYVGEIHAISAVFEENQKSLHVHADISNSKKELFPNMYIKGKIIIESIDVLALPEEAVLVENELSYIFVKTEKNETEVDKASEDNEEKWTFRKTEIIRGIKSGKYYQIKLLSEIPKNAQIVSYGAYYLLAEMGKGEVEDDD